MISKRGGATINRRPAPKQDRDEAGDVANDVREKGGDASPDDRERGETSDADDCTAHDRAS